METNKKNIIEMLEGVIQEIECGQLKVEDIEQTNSIELQLNGYNYKEKFNLIIDGHYEK